MRVTGQYYRALSGHRDELASTSYELYTDTSVRRTSAVQPPRDWSSACLLS